MRTSRRRRGIKRSRRYNRSLIPNCNESGVYVTEFNDYKVEKAMTLKLLGLIICFAALLEACASAQTFDNFDFSITSEVDGPLGPGIVGVPGTVTGELIGVPDFPSGSQVFPLPPSDIIITSIPDGLGINIPLGGYSLAANGWNITGGFGASDGTITYAASQNYNEPFSYLYLLFNVDGTNGFTFSDVNNLTNGLATEYALGNYNGVAGVNFTLVAPEPSGLALALLAIVAFGIMKIRCKSTKDEA